MRELLDFGLFLAGLCLIALVCLSFWVPRVLKWKEKLAVLSPLMRDIFLTYSLWALGSYVFFAVLTLGYRDWLLGGTQEAAWMNGFMMLWWALRLYLQIFRYDLDEPEDTIENRLAGYGLTVMFACLVLIFALSLWWGLSTTL